MSPIKFIPVDVGRLAGLLCTVAPETKTNPDTGEIKTDRDGNTQYVVGVSVREPGSRKPVNIDITTTVQPRGITEGTRVRLVELTASQWEMDGGRSGISWRAAEILPDTRPPDPLPPQDRSTVPPAKTTPKGGEA